MELSIITPCLQINNFSQMVFNLIFIANFVHLTYRAVNTISAHDSVFLFPSNTYIYLNMDKDIHHLSFLSQ